MSYAARSARSEHTDAENQILLGAPSKKNHLRWFFLFYFTALFTGQSSGRLVPTGVALRSGESRQIEGLTKGVELNEQVQQAVAGDVNS